MRLKQTNTLSDGRLLFAYWANNRGRGDNNCTLVIVDANTARPDYSKSVCQGNGFNCGDNWIRTSSWAGDVNVSKRVCEYLDIKKNDIVMGTN